MRVDIRMDDTDDIDILTIFVFKVLMFKTHADRILTTAEVFPDKLEYFVFPYVNILLFQWHSFVLKKDHVVSKYKVNIHCLEFTKDYMV